MTTTPRPGADNSSGATSQSDVAKIRVYKIRTGQVFDPIARVMLPRQVIWVDRETGIIIRLGEEGEAFRSEFEVEVTDVDLTKLTVLPGFVDVHVHRMLIPDHVRLVDGTDERTLSILTSIRGNTMGRPAHEGKSRRAYYTCYRSCKEDAFSWVYDCQV